MDHRASKRLRSAAGIVVTSAEEVADEALAAADRLLHNMLAGCGPAVLQALRGGEVAVIGRCQVTTDVPAHAWLRGQTTPDGRTYDEGTRGLGGTSEVPTTSVGEENLLMDGDDKYYQESILVHEFAHHVMNVGMGPAERRALSAAYQGAVAAGLYPPGSYIASNEDEYWAEGTQAWFHGTIRTDVTGGVTTRAALMARDPQLAGVMRNVWGQNTWKYTDTMLGTWPGVSAVPGGGEGGGGRQELAAAAAGGGGRVELAAASSPPRISSSASAGEHPLPAPRRRGRGDGAGAEAGGDGEEGHDAGALWRAWQRVTVRARVLCCM